MQMPPPLPQQTYEMAQAHERDLEASAGRHIDRDASGETRAAKKGGIWARLRSFLPKHKI